MPPTEESIKAAMMADLGIARNEELPMEDGERGRRGRGPPDRAHPPPPQRRTRKEVVPDLNQVALAAWNTAIKSGVFDDDDAQAVKGLDTMAGGRLHAQKREAQGYGGQGHGGQGYGGQGYGGQRNHGNLQAVMDQTTRALQQGRNNGREYPPWSKRGNYNSNPGTTHQGNQSIASIKPTRAHPIAANIQDMIRKQEKQQQQEAEKKKAAAAAAAAVPQGKLKVPKNIVFHDQAYIRVHGRKADHGNVFLCGTSVPSESAYVVFIGAEQVALYHPCLLEDYFTSAKDITLIFPGNVKVNMEFRDGKHLFKFWAEFRKLKDAGKGGGNLQASAVQAKVEPKIEARVGAKLASEVAVKSSSNGLEVTKTAMSRGVAPSAAATVVPQAASNPSADLIAFGSAAISTADRSVSGHAKSTSTSIDLITEGITKMKLGSSPPAADGQVSKPSTSSDQPLLVNLTETDRGENEKHVRQRNLSSSYDEELSGIQSSPPAQSAETDLAPATTAAIANGQAIASLKNDALPEETDPISQYIGKSMVEMMKALNHTYKGDRAKIEKFVLRYLEQVLGQDNPDDEEPQQLASPEKSPEKSLKKVADRSTVQPVAARNGVKQESPKPTPVQPLPVHTKVKVETHQPEKSSTKTDGFLKPEQASLNGRPPRPLSPDEMMMHRHDEGLPRELPRSVRQTINKLKLSPSTQAVQVEPAQDLSNKSTNRPAAPAAPAAPMNGNIPFPGAARQVETIRKTLRAVTPQPVHPPAPRRSPSKPIQVTDPNGGVVKMPSKVHQTVPAAADRENIRTTNGSTASKRAPQPGSGNAGLRDSRWA